MDLMTINRCSLPQLPQNDSQAQFKNAKMQDLDADFT